MANIRRFDPFSEMGPLAKDFFKGLSLQPILRGMEIEPDIRMDVSEDDKTYSIKAEVPGVRKEDIKVSIDANRVSISAEMKKESEEKDRKMVRRERSYGWASRSIDLDEDVDQDAAQAKYENGVLELTLPKKPGGQSRTIQIS